MHELVFVIVSGESSGLFVSVNDGFFLFFFFIGFPCFSWFSCISWFFLVSAHLESFSSLVCRCFLFLLLRHLSDVKKKSQPVSQCKLEMPHCKLCIMPVHFTLCIMPNCTMNTHLSPQSTSDDHL